MGELGVAEKARVWRSLMRAWGPDGKWWWEAPDGVWGTAATWQAALDAVCAYMKGRYGQPTT